MSASPPDPPTHASPSGSAPVDDAEESIDFSESSDSLPPGFRDFQTKVEDDDLPAPPSVTSMLQPTIRLDESIETGAPRPEPTREIMMDLPPHILALSTSDFEGTLVHESLELPGEVEEEPAVRKTATGSGAQTGPRLVGEDLDLEPGTVFEVRPGLVLVVERLLGKGGMGLVYLVRDPKIGRQLALKLIRGKQSSARVVRFTRETHVTARLNHPGIPPVNEAGSTVSGIHYILMRFVEGESLKRRLRRLWANGRVPLPSEIRELLQGLVRIGEAVAYAHNQRVVHRDLKPENIMIGDFGEVFVMDWGLARNLDQSDQDDASILDSMSDAMGMHDPDGGDQDLTRSGATLGTVGYMAPEQARGEVIDQRVDIFSLGVILTRILTGRSPLGDEPLERLDRTVANTILSPRQIDPQAPAELDAVAALAMQPNRRDRYSTADAFVEDVRAYLEGRRVGAYSYNPLDKLVRWIKRHPTLVVGIAALLLLGLGLFMVDRTRSQEVSQHVALGRAALDGGDAPAAQDEFSKALGIDGSSLEAKLGKLEAETAIHKAQQAEQERVAREREAAKARRYEEEAAAALAKKDYEGAMEASDLAIAFGSVDAKLLRDEALNGRAAELALEKEEEYRGRANELVTVAQALQAEGQLKQALRVYHQAMAFDGKNEAAKAGIESIHTVLAQHESKLEKLERERLAALEVKAARKLLRRAQASYRKGDKTILQVLDLHVEGLEVSDRALFLHPESKDAKAVRKELGMHLAAILRQEGHSQFETEFVLRMTGTDPNAAVAKIPRDEYLDVREGDLVRIRQVLGSPRFKRTRLFDSLRGYVRRNYPNLRLTILIRSRPIGGRPMPQVQLTSLWVQVEDRVNRVTRPPQKVNVPGRFLRPMTSDKLGRIIGSWEEARDGSRIKSASYVQQITKIASQELEKASK